jgi:hypothetical protein
VETLGLWAGVNFDLDGNGFAEQTGWVAPDDALLVFDRNDNGTVDNGSELFGNHTPVGAEFAAHGFEALAYLDTNLDGKISQDDAVYASLALWQDLNSNTHVDAGEMKSLESAGIVSVSTSYRATTAKDANGNSHLQTGTYVAASGLTGLAVDVWFTINPTRSVNVNPVPVSAEIAALPFIAGSGNVADLHQAIARDTSGRLMQLVRAFQQTQDKAARGEIVEELIYRWTGVYDVAPGSRGSSIGDARKLEALEEFKADEFRQLGTDPNPRHDASQMLLQQFADLAEFVSLCLDIGPEDLRLYNSVVQYWDAPSGQYVTDVSLLVDILAETYAADPVATLTRMLNFTTGILYFGERGRLVLDAIRAEGNLLESGLSYELAMIGT